MQLTTQVHIVPFKCQINIVCTFHRMNQVVMIHVKDFRTLDMLDQTIVRYSSAAEIIYILIGKIKIKMKIFQISKPFSIHYLAKFRLKGVLAVLDSPPVQEHSIKTVGLLLGKSFCNTLMERVSFHVF
jgi:hypothetical protein